MESKNSFLCLFDKPSVQTDVLSNHRVKYYPLSTLSVGSPIEFHIEGTGDEYIDPNDIYLHVRFKVLKSDGTDITASDKVGLNNLAIATLFQDVSLTAGDIQIEGGQQNYAYLAYISTMLQFHPSAQRSHMQMLGWYKDEATKFDAETNSGFVKRSALIENSKPVELIGPLFLDLFRQQRYILNNQGMRIKMIPSKPDFALNSYGPKGSYKIQFEEVSLTVARATMNPSVINGHTIGLRKQNAHYPVVHNRMITFTIPKGQSSFIKDHLFPNQSPRMLFIAMVENDAYNGNIKKNPFHFQHFDLSQIALYHGGRSIPGAPLKVDYANNLYLEAYYDLIRVLKYYNSDDTNGLTPNEYANGYTIFGFDLTAEKDIATADIQSQSNNNLRLTLNFSKDLPSTINVLVYAGIDGFVEITRLRDVITSYTF